MKAIFDDMIIKQLCLLCEKFHQIPINKKQIAKLRKFYINTTEKISDEEMEKAIACIYALQSRGIPLKASSTELGVKISDTLRLFKKLRTPSITYVPLFIELLKTGYKDDEKQRFDYLFNRLKPKVVDLFALATVINTEQKKSNTYFGYSEVTVTRYRKMIKEEI